jgi:hypothetical protein
MVKMACSLRYSMISCYENDFLQQELQSMKETLANRDVLVGMVAGGRSARAAAAFVVVAAGTQALHADNGGA